MLTALRPGRTKALVQRKRRKAHVASIAPGDHVWLTACDRTLVVEGTEFALLHEAVAIIEERDTCIRCRELYATADEFYMRGYAAGLAAANTPSSAVSIGQ